MAGNVFGAECTLLTLPSSATSTKPLRTSPQKSHQTKKAATCASLLAIASGLRWVPRKPAADATYLLVAHLNPLRCDQASAHNLSGAFPPTKTLGLTVHHCMVSRGHKTHACVRVPRLKVGNLLRSGCMLRSLMHHETRGVRKCGGKQNPEVAGAMGHEFGSPEWGMFGPAGASYLQAATHRHSPRLLIMCG
jgi:hypothetical protein